MLHKVDRLKVPASPWPVTTDGTHHLMMNLVAPARIIIFFGKGALVRVVALSADVLNKLVIHIMWTMPAFEHRFA